MLSFSYTGSATLTHLVDYSWLPKPEIGCALADSSVSAGRLIREGPTLDPGLFEKGYISGLKWISQKYFLLWDEADKRGWLINGHSALLHLVRISLEHDRTDKFQSAFVFDRDKIKESSEPLKADSAIAVLLDEHNAAMKIYRDGNAAQSVPTSELSISITFSKKLITHQQDVRGPTVLESISKDGTL